MAEQVTELAPAVSLRDRLKEETRQIIVEAFAACLADSEVDKITFADVAARAGVGERTVYRHFATREELLRALYVWLSRQTNPDGFLPDEETALITRLRDFFVRFDAYASVMKAAVITPQGYEMRRAAAGERDAAFRAAVADAVRELPESERVGVAAMVQHIHSAGAWLSLRDWGLSGEEAARVCTWAIAALLRDARARKGPLGPDEP